MSSDGDCHCHWSQISMSLLGSFFSGGGAGDSTQGLTQAKHMLYHQVTPLALSLVPKEGQILMPPPHTKLNGSLPFFCHNHSESPLLKSLRPHLPVLCGISLLAPFASITPTGPVQPQIQSSLTLQSQAPGACSALSPASQSPCQP